MHALSRKWYGEGIRTAQWLSDGISAAQFSMHVAPYIRVSEHSSIQNYIVDLQVRYGGEGRYESLR